MATLRQVLANRLNASKSTGPVTAEGKAIVARNAVKHAVFAENLLAEGDDPAELEEFRAALLADLAPQTPSQRMLAERIISANWRLRRLSSAEEHLHRSIADAERNELGEDPDDNVGYPGQAEDTAHAAKAREGSRERERREDLIEQRRREWAKQQICPAGLTLAIDLEADQSVIERYSRYEKRLEGTIHRAWRELRLLRKDAEGHAPSPLVGEGGGEGEKVQTRETVPPPQTVVESAPRELLPIESAPLTPHPSPLPQGEREPEPGQDAASMANVQNKPNSPASDAPAEVYGEAKAQPLPRVILRALPGQFLDDLLK
jgi:hypothetical protein